MKIAMVVPVFPKLSETFIAGKFLGLLRRGHDVRVICQTFDPGALAYFPGLAERNDLTRRVVVRRPAEPRWRAAMAAPAALANSIGADWRNRCRYLSRGGREFGLDLPRQLYLDAELIECRPDIVHFEFGTLARGRVEQIGWLGGKSVVSFRGHDLLFVGIDSEDFYADVWKHADALHFLGTALWQAARRRGCPAGKSHRLIAPAIDAVFFKPAARETYGVLGGRRPVRLVGAGRLDWTKGYEYALQAVARLRNQGVNVEYRIVGDGGQRNALSFARREMGLETSVTFLGGASPATVRDELQRADIFLHAAVAEGFSNAVLEAQAMELPIVSSDACGLPENVAAGVTGFVVPRRDPAALADQILKLAVQPELRRTMGRAGRRRVLEEFDPEKQIDAFEELYESVVVGEPARSPRESVSGLAIRQHPAA